MSATPEHLAAMKAAILGEEAPAEPTPAAAEPAQAPATVTEPAAEAPAGAEPAAVTQPTLDDAGRMRGPDGKFTAATPKPAEPAPVVEPPKATQPIEPPKPADPVNDPIPENVKPATRERITTLVDTVKAKDTELTAARAEVASAREDFDLLMAPIRESGASVDQFKEAMNLVKLLNSPHVHEKAQALQYLQQAGSLLAEQLGHVPQGVDPLQGFPDLQEAVAGQPALRAWAEELAKSRRLTAATQRQQQTSYQQSQQAAEQQREAQAGQAAVKQLEQTLEAADPQYKAKVAALRADSQFLNSIRSLPPQQWASAFAEGYRSVKIAPAVVPAAPATPANSPSPLRAKQPAGTAAQLPTSSLEAVTAAVRAVGQR